MVDLGHPFASHARAPLAILVVVLMISGLTWGPTSSGAAATVLAPDGDPALAQDHGSHDHGSPGQGTPPENPARGLVYRGLRPAQAGGPCDGRGFEVTGSIGETGCTHGPDAAPAGIDVREPHSLASLRAGAEDGEATATAAATAVDCIGDGVSGNRVQAIYAHASNVPSRYASVAPLIRGYAASMDLAFKNSAAKTGGTRRIRWVTASGCELSVLHVTLTAAGDDDLSTTRSELRAQGHNRTDRKYAVWMDANVYCGIAFIEADDSPGATNRNNGTVQGMVSRTDTQCWGHAEAHELMHNLGGVQLSAPHSSGLWHCTDEHDVMCYADGTTIPLTFPCASSAATLFDCRNDDYFHTNPPAGSYLATHWNTANSSFLDRGIVTPPPTAYALTVTRAGTGTGTVTSVPAGISCGTDCSESYASGTVVTLTASPAAGSAFSGWTGACTGTGSCAVTMSQARSATATFAPSGAPTYPVTSTDLGFTPAVATIARGTVVHWSFLGPGSHGVRDATGLFDTGSRAPGTTFGFTYTAAGGFAYVDAVVPSLAGSVTVPMTVTPASGVRTTTFTPRWATMTAPYSWVYDVQIRRPGRKWLKWRTGVTYPSASFVPDRGTGTYSFRAKLRNTSTGATSGFSPTLLVLVS